MTDVAHLVDGHHILDLPKATLGRSCKFDHSLVDTIELIAGDARGRIEDSVANLARRRTYSCLRRGTCEAGPACETRYVVDEARAERRDPARCRRIHDFGRDLESSEVRRLSIAQQPRSKRFQLG